MNSKSNLIFLLDVDNTLLDNDAVIKDIDHEFGQQFGEENRQRYWDISTALRRELGYVDYLGALQRYRNESRSDPRLYTLSSFLLDYPFSQRLFPQTLDVLQHLSGLGPTVIVSDGDIVFQPRKIQRSGLWDAVEGRVLIYQHKEQMLYDIARRYPAHHYVMVDDKLQILSAMKKSWADLLTTVFVRQGHYAHDKANVDGYPAADISIETIADLLEIDFADHVGWAIAQHSLCK